MPKQKSIGALWVKESGKCGKYMTGQIDIEPASEMSEGNIIKLVVFKNTYKKEDKHPDYRIFISQPKQEEEEAF